MDLALHTHFIDKIAFANGLISGVALYPQVAALFMYGTSEGLSLVSFAIIFLNSAVWLVYALHRKLISLTVASVLNMTASGLLVGGILVL